MFLISKKLINENSLDKKAAKYYLEAKRMLQTHEY